jgi:YesN/AraC family two-component response regulator
MNILVIVLASLCVLLAAAVVYLRMRLGQQKQEAGMQLPELSDEVTVTDQFLYDRCCRYMMERKPFLVTDYQLQDLANALYTNRLYLSKTINRYSGKNFRAYVNYYRVMYAMELFRSNLSLRINDLAHLSGFRNESSFLNSFKNVMGEAPSFWCARIRLKYREKLKK